MDASSDSLAYKEIARLREQLADRDEQLAEREGLLRNSKAIIDKLLAENRDLHARVGGGGASPRQQMAPPQQHHAARTPTKGVFNLSKQVLDEQNRTLTLVNERLGEYQRAEEGAQQQMELLRGRCEQAEVQLREKVQALQRSQAEIGAAQERLSARERAFEQEESRLQAELERARLEHSQAFSAHREQGDKQQGELQHRLQQEAAQREHHEGLAEERRKELEHICEQARKAPPARELLAREAMEIRIVRRLQEGESRLRKAADARARLAEQVQSLTRDLAAERMEREALEQQLGYKASVLGEMGRVIGGGGSTARGATAAAAISVPEANGVLRSGEILAATCTRLGLARPADLIPFANKISSLLVNLPKFEAFVEEVAFLASQAAAVGGQEEPPPRDGSTRGFGDRHHEALLALRQWPGEKKELHELQQFKLRVESTLALRHLSFFSNGGADGGAAWADIGGSASGREPATLADSSRMIHDLVDFERAAAELKLAMRKEDVLVKMQPGEVSAAFVSRFLQLFGGRTIESALPRLQEVAISYEDSATAADRLRELLRLDNGASWSDILGSVRAMIEGM